MASLGALGGFDATEHDTSQRDFTPLPDGDYRLEVIESDIVPTKDGSGQRLTGAYSVLAPEELKNRKVFFGFNIVNKNPQAQQIGQSEFARLCRAVGVTNPSDTEELHFKEFAAKVGLEKKREGYPQRNEIKKFYYPDEGDLPEAKAEPGPAPAANDNRPSANDNKPAASPAPSRQAAGSRPWGKR